MLETEQKFLAHEDGMPKVVDYETAMFVLNAIDKWWKTRENPANEYSGRITTRQGFRIEATHALRGGLLGRLLLEGKEPLPKPPPRSMSRPWYSLIEQGGGVTISVWALNQVAKGQEYIPLPGEEIVVGQSAGWKLIEAHGPTDWTITHPGVGACRATRYHKDGWDLWKLVVLKESP